MKTFSRPLYSSPSVFLLALVDAVSIVTADAVGTGKHR